MRGKPWPTDSQEGCLLSCSNCAEDWSRIARLGAGVEWTILKNKPIRLLDFHNLSKKTRKEWLAAAASAELIYPTIQYKVSSTDEEGEEVYSLYGSEKTALAECNDHERPTKINGWVASKKLAAFWNGKRKIEPIFVETAALVFWAFKTCKLDGIWWNDIFDPEQLSAPRIGIHPKRIKSVNRRHNEINLK